MAYDNEETLTKIAQLNAAGTAGFRVKIHRKRPGSPFPEHIATFDGVSIDHLMTPETWLGKVGGGGSYNVYVHTLDSPNTIGKPLQFVIGTPAQSHDFDPRIAASGDWRGPSVLIFPDPNERPVAPSTITVAAGSPVGVGPSSAAPQTSASGLGTGQPGAGVFIDVRAQGEIAALRSELDRMRADRERADREAEQARHARELEKVRADAQLQIEKLAAEVKASVNREPAKPALDLTGLLTAAGPLLQTFLSESRASREAAQRAADENARATRELIAKIAEKPVIDPIILSLIKDKDSGSATEQFMAMPKVMSAFSELAGNFAETISALQQGDSEPPAVRVAGALADALKTVGQGLMMSNANKKRPQAPRPQLPPQGQGQLPPNVRPLPARQGAQPAPQALPTPAEARANFAGADPTATSYEQQARAPVPAQGAPQVAPHPLDEVIVLVQKGTPPERVIDYVFDHMDDPRVISELEAAGTFQQVFAQRVMADDVLREWAFDSANQPYIQALLAQFSERAAQDPRFVQEGEEGEVDGEEADPGVDENAEQESMVAETEQEVG